VQKFRGWRVDESTGPNVEMPVSTEATYASFGKLHVPAHLRLGFASLPALFG